MLLNPFALWKVKENRYPIIAILTRRYLCISATSALSEQLFPAAGLTIAKDRARLLPDNEASLVFWFTARGSPRL